MTRSSKCILSIVASLVLFAPSARACMFHLEDGVIRFAGCQGECKQIIGPDGGTDIVCAFHQVSEVHIPQSEEGGVPEVFPISPVMHEPGPETAEPGLPQE